MFYNAINQPTTIFGGTLSTGMNFGFDPLGRCVKRWVSASGAATTNPATYLYYDGWNLIQEGTGAAAAERIYLHGNRVDGVVCHYNYTAAQWRYHHYDARGHCILLTNPSGALIEQYEYDAFGKPYFYNGAGTPLSNGSAAGNRFLFTGREYLSELKLYDYRHLLYQPELGRFLQPDPKNFEAGDYNLYRYCHNDPINLSDPFGLWSPEAHDKIIENALKDRFSKDDIKAIQQASREFDKATQSAKDANKHAMRQAGQSAENAKAETQRFVNDRMRQARAAEKAGDHAGALKKFGEAMHPVMDSSSPMHTNPDGNPKPYYGIISALGHSPSDVIGGKETSRQLTPSILSSQSALINSAADQVFGE